MSGGFDPRPVANRFWERVGEEELFPRHLRRAIAVTLPVAVISLPRLSVGAMAEWLAKKRAGHVASTPDRPLRGCLIAQRGHAFLFVDGSIKEDEQRLTIAHETGHFLQHYDGPRRAALELLGPSIVPVLDGDRLPTPQERLRGALRSAPVGVYEHMLDRHDGEPDPLTARLEVEADLIAFELLAPTFVVLRSTKPGPDCRDALVDRFGLPGWAAARWGEWIDAKRVHDGLFGRLEAARAKNDAEMSKSTSGMGSQ